MGLFDSCHVATHAEIQTLYKVPGPNALPFTGCIIGFVHDEKIIGPVAEHYVLTAENMARIITLLSESLYEITKMEYTI